MEFCIHADCNDNSSPGSDNNNQAYVQAKPANSQKNRAKTRLAAANGERITQPVMTTPPLSHGIFRIGFFELFKVVFDYQKNEFRIKR